MEVGVRYRVCVRWRWGDENGKSQEISKKVLAIGSNLL